MLVILKQAPVFNIPIPIWMFSIRLFSDIADYFRGGGGKKAQKYLTFKAKILMFNFLFDEWFYIFFCFFN